MIIWTKISSVDLHNFLRLLNLVMDALNARWVWQIFLLQLKECCACVAHSFSFVSFADDFLSENDRILNQCKEDKDDAGQQPDLHGCDRVRHRDSSSAIKTWKTTWVHFRCHCLAKTFVKIEKVGSSQLSKFFDKMNKESIEAYAGLR